MEHLVDIVAQLQPYAELATPLKFEGLRTLVEDLGDTVGLPGDQLRYVLCLFGAYPLALLYRFLPSATLKHLFDVIVGLSMAQFVLGSAWIHSFLAAITTYVLVSFGPPKYAPYLAFVFNMAYMSMSHIYRLYVDYMGWTLDFTGPQMLLVIKLTSFAFNYYDGVVDKTAQQAALEGKELSPSMARLYRGRERFLITALPNPLEFFGYVYSFTTFLAGPAFEIREYLDVARGTKFMFNGEFKRPSGVLAVCSKLFVGSGLMAAFALYGSFFPIEKLRSFAVASLPWYLQIKELYVTLIFVKIKYYGAWKIAEGSTVLCGFGFEGFDKDGTAKGWNGVSNIDIVSFELAASTRDASKAWNKGTQNWLERYVYTRTGNSLFMTYFTSAFWHGFYPGYYFFFLSLPLMTMVNRLAHKRLRPRFLEADGSEGLKKKVYDIIGTIATILGMHYFVMPFQVMSFEYSLQALKNVNFAGHIVCVVLYVLFSLVPVPKEKKKTD